MELQPRDTDALIVIDMQRDFLPGGSLAVVGGDEIIPGINEMAGRFAHVILTQDWHPRGHVSFASTHKLQPFTDFVETPGGTQALWPDHCAQGTFGAEIDPRIEIPHAELLLRKGFRKNIDSYSAFLENDHITPTGLAGYLRERQIERLYFVGVALDFCVGFSAVDAVKLGFESVVIEELTRAIGLAGTVESTNDAFMNHGVTRMIHAGI